MADNNNVITTQTSELADFNAAETQALISKVQSAIDSGKLKLASQPIKRIIYACLLVGIGCLANTIVKSWIGTPNALDWGILFVGLVLCAISLLKEFKVGKEGVSATIADISQLLQATKALSRMLIK